MGIRHNIAKIIRLYKDKSGKSLEGFAAELGISRSSLQSYLDEDCNPRADTIEYLADKLNIDPAMFVTYGLSDDQLDIAFILTQQLALLYSLSPEKRTQFAKLFMEILELFNT